MILVINLNNLKNPRGVVMEPSQKLNITFAGVKMRSPLGVGAVAYPMGQFSAITPEMHAEYLLKHVEAGAGYVETLCSYVYEQVMKQKPEPREYPSIFSPTRWMKVDGMDGLYCFDVTITAAYSGLFAFDQRRRIIEILKRRVPERVAIIASHAIMESPELNVISAKKVEELGVDLLELQLAPCAYELGAEGVTEAYLEDVDGHLNLVEEIVAAVAKAVRIPVGVKLTPGEFGYPRVPGLVRRFRDAGAKYVQISNSGHAIAPPDIYNRGKSRYPYTDGNPIIGVSGAPLRTECYRDVAGIAKFAPGIEIAASGGFMKPEHAVEVMMLGANLVQFCTGLLFHGRRLLRRSTQFLERFLEEQGYRSVGELVGLGLEHVKPVDRVELANVVAEVDQAKCTGCGICTDHICLAMEEREDGNAQVNRDLCFGCGLCVETCPSQAVRLLPR